MSRNGSIARCQVVILDDCGMRMRTAARFIGMAGQFQSEVWVLHDGRRYNGKSMRDLLTMVADHGERLEFEAFGPDAEAAVAALADLVQSCPA